MATRIFIFLQLLSPFLLVAQLQSPSDFLPHKLGEHFTPHHLVVDYFQHVDRESDYVHLIEYGRTSEHRPMLLAFVSTPENLKNLEDIRLQHLRNAGIVKGNTMPDLDKAIVWLSFSVHGNEAAGTESAQQVIFDLVDPANQKTKSWLENTIVIIDPSVNPDGFSRYTHWVRGMATDKVNPEFDDIEHQEPWPNGRVNHYLFDLNRDWAWQTQIESQQRMKVFNQWVPHVHADLHEMGHNSSYYFAPAAKPYHEYITQWQKDFQTEIGHNHASYFDEEGWLYFTKEVFDLLYPSYGDTYPTFLGSIGMTYEQGGSGRGGRAVKTTNGEILSLKDRIEHHKTTALSTVEVSSKNKDRLLKHFHDFYHANKTGTYKAYVIKADKNKGAIKALASFLDKQNIEYGSVAAQKSLNGFDYQKFKNSSFSLEPGDMVIRTNQPRSVMTQVLFDPSTTIEDSLTYDITAWSMPYAYGLQAYALTQDVSSSDFDWNPVVQKANLTDAYAYVIPASGMESHKILSKLLQEGITARINQNPMSFNNHSFDAGSIIVNKADNRTMAGQFLQKLQRAVGKYSGQLVPLQSGFAKTGSDLGSGRMALLRKPKVLTVIGDGLEVNACGQVKHYFENVIDYPATIVHINRLFSIQMSKYNTLVLPNGRYNFSESQMKTLNDWIRNGGKVIAMGGATRIFADKPGYTLKRYEDDKDKSAEEKENKSAAMAARYNHYSDAERLSISSYVPGAIFQTKIDQTHPMGFNMGDTYFSLKTSSISYPLLQNASNVGYLSATPKTIGFVGKKAQKKLANSIVFAVENKGRGSIVYMVDNPLFRGFWYNGLRLFSNALFFVN